ncbi:glycosyltransferase [Methylacidimicrobium sp. B4]|uniref:glycosyltransferase n=1 Tax=Methylacidimicrobium sp. B4 TaxID=2796139 RepID=UPI001A907385|nr:glycosyltransferase [Methylacidimicrobium sp. B4]QSR84392.1 glycosyltransferase [Methylacidimicrobium sp. B4]
MKSRAVLVLGMHRCGTSALTRCLGLLGVELGSELIEPAADNPTGFWEDGRFLSINQRLTQLLGEEGRWWEYLLPPEVPLSSSGVRSLIAEAVEEIERRFAPFPLWALKDPRTLRVLPFWEEVLHQAGVGGEVVLAVRHPLACAHSLLRRDGIPEDRSLLLWTSQYLAHWPRLAARPFLAVDYDRVLEEPERELRRLCGRLGLPWSKAALAEARTFLQPELRHSRFVLRDLRERPDVPPLVVETFEALEELCVHPEAKTASARMAALHAEFGRMVPLLRTLDGEMSVARRSRQELSAVRGLVEARDRELAQLHEERTEAGSWRWLDRLRGERSFRGCPKPRWAPPLALRQRNGERRSAAQEVAHGDAGGRREIASGGALLGLLPWHPLAAERPLFRSGLSSWTEHIPFAFWLVAALRPKVVVEVGTTSGDSYLAFCQAIEALSLPARAHAVDASNEEEGRCGGGCDEELKRCHDERYGRFSRLLWIQSDGAVSFFSEGSIDLLHLAGCPRYEVMREEFSRWRPKVSRGGVVLLPGVTEWRNGCGVWRLWNELREVYPSFLFPHAGGLGVLRIGPEAPEAIRRLVTLSGSRAARVRRCFEQLGKEVASGSAGGAEPRERGRGSLEPKSPRDETLAEPALILEAIRRDPAWRLLRGMRMLSRRSGELLTRAHALAHDLADEGLPSSSRWQALAALEPAVKSLASSRSFRIFADLATTSRRFVRGDREGVAAQLRDALRMSFPVLLPAAGAGEVLPWRDSLGFPLGVGGEKGAVLERYRAALDGFLQRGDRLALPLAAEPEISIVLVLFNQAELTYACLRSLAIHLALPVEVILVDNASTDRTGELLQRVKGVRLLRNGENLHFLRAANQGAAAARGRLLLFLNNDAQILPETVEAAREALESDPAVGAVGGRIVNLEGRLQEAGSFVWGDGTPQGYGRGDSPLRRNYLFRRETDYCSGAFLLTYAALFREMGGLDEVFAPAYFEEADYCLRLWERGRRVLYEPEAVVLHWEFGSSDAKSASGLMERNRQLFVERHRSFLEGRPPPRPGPLLAPIAPRARVRLLYVDDRVPRPELGAGYPRANAIVRELVGWGAQVTLFPMSGAWEDWEEIYWNLPREVEVLRGMDASVLQSHLEARAGAYDLAWISRPYNMARLSAIDGRKRLLAGSRLVYDAEAVFALREIRQAEIVQGRAVPGAEERRRIGQEIAWARSADRVVAVSEEEAQEFRRRGIDQVRVIGHALPPAPTRASFAERKDFLLVGAVRDWQGPNGDALLWFAQKVFPKVREGLAAAPPRLVVVGDGSDSPELLRRLGPGTVGIGTVADLTPYYERARVFVAPTRFAAGIPMKAHEAAARGVPMVASSLIAHQLGWRTGEELLSAPVEDEEAFAAACRNLYTDPLLWERVRAGALASVTRDCDPKRFREAIQALLDELAAPKLPR